MKRTIRFSVPLVLSLILTQTAFAFDDGDLQNWSSIAIEGKLNKEWTVLLDEELRFGDDVSDLFYQRTDLGITYQMLPWLKLGLNYWHQYSEKNGNWKLEQKPHFNATIKFKIGSFTLQDRSRLERRIFEDADNQWRYRNKLSLTPPVKFTKFSIQPYVADEIFINFEDDAYRRNRIYLGCKSKLAKRLALDIYYLLQSDKAEPDWKKTHVIGSKLKISF